MTSVTNAEAMRVRFARRDSHYTITTVIRRMDVNVLGGSDMMIAEPEVAAKIRTYPESDAKYRSTKAMDFWEVVETAHFASGAMQLRLRVTYPNGTVHMLGAAFADRSALNNYIDRWLPTFEGREKTA